jgi:hypothetical protein
MPSFFDTNGLMLPNHSRVDYRGGKKFQQRTRGYFALERSSTERSEEFA